MVEALSEDPVILFTKVQERELITRREYNNLKDISNREKAVIDLVDKIMGKGEETCQKFLNLLETDGEIKSTYSLLRNIPLSTSIVPTPVQATRPINSGMLRCIILL